MTLQRRLEELVLDLRFEAHRIQPERDESTYDPEGELGDLEAATLRAVASRIDTALHPSHGDSGYQQYVNGEFCTRCTCGAAFFGPTPDDADAAWTDHADLHLDDPDGHTGRME